jgi:RimJ/RimL family protein N-acetyltransferase
MTSYTPMPFSIETERLSLRLRTREDAVWNLQLLGEHEGGTELTLAEAEQHLAEQNVAAHAVGFGFLAIQHRAQRDFIGYCGLLVGRATFDEPELAYELLQLFHGYGHATEAASAVLDAAFATGRRRLWATVGGWNARSFRVLEKLGFYRDHSVTDERGELVYMVRDNTSVAPSLSPIAE